MEPFVHSLVKVTKLAREQESVLGSLTKFNNNKKHNLQKLNIQPNEEQLTRTLLANMTQRMKTHFIFVWEGVVIAR